ncbi:MAG TPA: TonB-dependent receptor [Methylocystis sp.]|nr:TonB-dependent receptor [Methylocystis sp.]
MRRRTQAIETSLLTLVVACFAAPSAAQTKLPDITVTHPKPKVVHHAPQPTARPVVSAAPSRAAAAPQRVTQNRPAPAPARAPEPAPAAPQPASPSQDQSRVEQAEQHFNATQQASSELFTTGKQINAVPFSRPGEALETAVPGLVVTQHSGEGKANQYQLRGFQLDHGTDFAITLDGMPLNMPTHGHGQGYADANFLIPELISYVDGRKGPYFADEGDFSSAGAVYIYYRNEVPKGLFSATTGSFDYGRLLGIDTNKVNGGNLLSAVELGIYNGPWTVPDAAHKINGVLRWSTGTPENGLAIDAMAYANRWHASNQIPQRAVSEGFISRWGNIDPSDRGNTTRFSLSGRWTETDAQSHSIVEAFAIHSTLNLFNDFDYFLTQPQIGDQFRQFDRRYILGLKAEHGQKYEIAGIPVETRIGLQSRYDNIRLGIQDTYRTVPYDTVTNDQVPEGNVGLWTDTTIRWTPWLRTVAGMRGDFFAASIGNYQDPRFAPTGDVFWNWPAPPLFPTGPIWTGPWNSGHKAAVIESPKASIIFGPWQRTEFYLNYGEGFHSNDARGTVSTLGPTDGSQVAPVPFLTKSRGAEGGIRTKFIDGLDSTISLWWLNFDSESVFEGDTGNTVFGRPSRRYGIELTNRYTYSEWLRFDANLAVTHTRYRGWDVEQTLNYASLLTPDAIGYFTYLGNAPGNYIPEGPPIIASADIELGRQTGWFGALKYRFKGAYPLTEDGYFKAPATGVLDLRAGYRWENGLKLQLDVFNALGSRSDQITYAYGSLLQTDPLYWACQAGAAPDAVCAIGQMDRHYHPLEPTAARVTLSGPLTLGAFDPIFAPEPGAHTPGGDFLALVDAVTEPPAPETSAGSALPSHKAPLVVAPVPRWTGFYLGATTGAAWSANNNIYYANTPIGPTSDPGVALLGSGNLGESNVGFIGGGGAGYNLQVSPRALVGFEADLQGVLGGTGASNEVGARPSYALPGGALLGNVAASQTLDYLGTARLRMGYLLRPSLLVYGTGGLAYGRTNFAANAQVLTIDGTGNIVALGGGQANTSRTRAGFAAGGGFEWMFMPGLSAKAEYLYYDLGSYSAALPQYAVNLTNGAALAEVSTSYHGRANGQLVRAGLNYHFDWGAPAAIIAKY